MAPPGPSISVRAWRDFNQCGGLSSCRVSKLFPADEGIPVMMAGSIQLRGLSQFRLLMIVVLDVGALWLVLEGEGALGCPPKLMLMFGSSALSPSCHSFIFKPSIELLWSAIGIPPRPVLCCCARFKSKKLLFEVGFAVWFKCMMLLRGKDIQG